MLRANFVPEVRGVKTAKRQKAQQIALLGQRQTMVGVAGFELATPCTPCKCATRLRYTPTNGEVYDEIHGILVSHHCA